MARIAGVNLPVNKHTNIGLTAIFGIGRTRANELCAITRVNPQTKIKDLTEAELEALRSEIAKFQVEGDLRRKVALDIKHLIETGSYRGQRHRRGLPVRGQRTKTNARTRKGKRKSTK